MKKVAPALGEVGAAVVMILGRRQQVRELNSMVKIEAHNERTQYPPFETAYMLR